MKKLFAVCLSLCLAMALFAVPAFAEGDVAQVEGGQAHGKMCIRDRNYIIPIV